VAGLAASNIIFIKQALQSICRQPPAEYGMAMAWFPTRMRLTETGI
jgi:hypothetical protein